jgi:hypothetical protein
VSSRLLGACCHPLAPTAARAAAGRARERPTHIIPRLREGALPGPRELRPDVGEVQQGHPPADQTILDRARQVVGAVAAGTAQAALGRGQAQQPTHLDPAQSTA